MDDTSNSPVLAGTHDLRHHWRWLMAFGFMLYIFGIAAIVGSGARFVAMSLFGLMLFGGGIVQLAHGLANRQWGAYIMPLALSGLYLTAGLILMARPTVGVIPLSMMMMAFFVSAGILRITASLASANFPSSNWVLVNGIVDVLLGVLLWSQWPATGLREIGLFSGIEMLFAGTSLVLLSLAARRYTAAGGETIRLAA